MIQPVFLPYTTVAHSHTAVFATASSQLSILHNFLQSSITHTAGNLTATPTTGSGTNPLIRTYICASGVSVTCYKKVRTNNCPLFKSANQTAPHRNVSTAVDISEKTLSFALLGNKWSQHYTVNNGCKALSETAQSFKVALGYFNMT